MLMKDLIADFTNHLEKALKIGEAAKLTPASNPIQNILITGLGGSGIGGTIISQIAEKEIKIPISVCKDYFIPAWVSANTLVIVCSYSGNTEETLQAFEEAMKRNAKIVCVSSGGKIIEKAKENNLDHIVIPGGMPPRACIGYSLTQLFYVLAFFRLISESFRQQIKKTIHLLRDEESNIHQHARALAWKLIGKIPVIYSAADFEGVAIRFRQQINENSKMLCWHNALPEMNHNELVGWTEKHDDLVVIILRNENDYSRTQRRMEITKEVAGRYTPNIEEIYSKGETQLEKSLYLIHYTDWVSWYVAEFKNIDATEVKIIDYLKGELGKI